MTPGLYRLSSPEGALAPTGIVKVIQDDRGFPTIWIDELKRWPIHMLPEGSALEEISAHGTGAGETYREEDTGNDENNEAHGGKVA